MGSFIPSMILDSAGYVADATQTSQSLAAIKFCFTWLPAVFFAIGAVIMLKYVKYEKKEGEIKQELHARGA